VTATEIVTVKLSLILAAGLAYLGIMSAYVLTVGEGGGRLEVNLATVVFSSASCVLLGCLWQLLVWRFGMRTMMPVLGISASLLFLLVMLPVITLAKRGLVGVNEVWLFQLLSNPLWMGLFLVAFALLLYLVWRVAIPILERSDPD
jgi:hypothetical protein